MKYKILLELENEEQATWLFYALCNFAGCMSTCEKNQLIHRGIAKPEKPWQTDYYSNLCGNVGDVAFIKVTNDFVGREDGTIIHQSIYNDIGDNLDIIANKITDIKKGEDKDKLCDEILKLIDKIKEG